MSINQKSGRQTFRRRFVSGSLFVLPCPPECNFQSETKIGHDLRLGLVRPKFKKVNMDLIKKNYRVVSNLGFLSKITAKATALQVSDHESFNQMFPEFQSDYRKNHSEETALLPMRNDILVSMNQQQVTLLVFLDLSAAFGTVDHDMIY